MDKLRMSYEEYIDLGNNINIIMEVLKETEPDTYSLDQLSEQSIKALLVIEGMVDWQQDVNKGIDITVTKPYGKIVMKVSDFKDKVINLDNFSI
jgi:hypothetical protein